MALPPSLRQSPWRVTPPEAGLQQGRAIAAANGTGRMPRTLYIVAALGPLALAAFGWVLR